MPDPSQLLETLRQIPPGMLSKAEALRIVSRYWLLESSRPDIETEATLWADHAIAEV
jgi:hypothetical protein